MSDLARQLEPHGERARGERRRQQSELVEGKSARRWMDVCEDDGGLRASCWCGFAVSAREAKESGVRSARRGSHPAEPVPSGGSSGIEEAVSLLDPRGRACVGVARGA